MTNQPKTAKDSAKTEAEQLPINDHDKATFEAMINESLRCGGLNLVAGKGHGKTRLMFAIADHIRSMENTRIICFDGSEAWLRSYSQIAVYNINEADIIAKQQRNVLDIEGYVWQNWQLVLKALNSHDDILVRLKTKRNSKRSFAIRSIINYLDDIQRQQSELDKPLKKLCYFIDETEACFNNRATARIDSELFLTAFNEGRNFNESFYTSSQRLNDMSKTLRTKQSYSIGKINPEDITPQIRRIEKLYNVNLTTLPLRTWLFEGQLFKSPEFKQNKKPFIINAEVRKTYNQNAQPIKYKLIPASNPKRKSLLSKIFSAIFPKVESQKFIDPTTAQKINEDSKGDFLMLDEPDLIFSEEE
jgi:hypothetical protein